MHALLHACMHVHVHQGSVPVTHTSCRVCLYLSSLSGHLASLMHSKSMAYVVSLVRSLGAPVPPVYWIGMYSRAGGPFTWTDGRPASFLYFDPLVALSVGSTAVQSGNTSSTGGGGGGGVDLCAAAPSDIGNNWAARSCSETLPYVCMREYQSVAHACVCTCIKWSCPFHVLNFHAHHMHPLIIDKVHVCA